jgi:hypothetical protein
MLTNRNRQALKQYAVTKGLEARLEESLATLEEILPQLGEQSQSRQMINRIGALLMQEEVIIVAPSCPDYSHINGRYTFGKIGGGIPLLAEVHCSLLSKLSTKIPRAKYQIVVADQEVNDQALCARLAVSKEDFLAKIKESVLSLRSNLPDSTWTVDLMTKRFPDLLSLEERLRGEINANANLRARIISDTISRSGMYQKIGVYDSIEMRQRTITTAAQYSALANIAARDGLLVCNHETVNLAWYNEYQAAVLHNPVSIY